MIEIKNAKTIDGKRTDRKIPSDQTKIIDASTLTLLPALIDPHVHFRVPGAEHKETWATATDAAVHGGVTTVFDMPNNTPSCITLERLKEKKKIIDGQLKIPIRYGLYLGADQNHLEEIARCKDEIVGVKIYMGSSTGDLLMKDPAALEKAFQIAGENDVLVAVHAEDEDLIQERKRKLSLHSHASDHSIIRNAEVAKRAAALAIELAAKYGVRLYIAHTSTKEELDLVRQAKRQKLKVFAETTPHHMFLTTKLYEKLGTMALVNPPLRDTNEPVWEAIHDGTIDTIGTDHAPHLLEEKRLPYGKAPSGFPSIELYLALLLNAHAHGKISLEQIVRLTHTRPREIFRIKENDDVVLVDLEKTKTVEDAHLRTKAKWSPYHGMTLKGWPKFTILKGRVYEIT
ncbi:MAG: dihydroorotase [Parachlamydiales bacterium]|nr:dihydroorotase [Parachlamydiales bacterium]